MFYYQQVSEWPAKLDWTKPRLCGTILVQKADLTPVGIEVLVGSSCDPTPKGRLRPTPCSNVSTGKGNQPAASKSLIRETLLHCRTPSVRKEATLCIRPAKIFRVLQRRSYRDTLYEGRLPVRLTGALLQVSLLCGRD